MIDSIMRIMLIVIIKCEVEIGFGIPRGGYSVFMKKPINIKNATLNPTEYRTVSIVLTLFDFSICRINNPGTNVRKTNPSICLRKGTFRSIAKSVRRSIEIINAKYSLAPNLLFCSILILFINLADSNYT